jgi:hypothetical protein
MLNPDQEAIKRALVSANPDFYLRNAKSPLATYKVLYYRMPFRGFCKVDLLLPGIMNLPALPTKLVVTIDDLPITPFALLLITKLQCWDDHCKAPEQFKREKQYTDIIDIETLLGLKYAVALRKERPWTSAEMFSPELQALTKRRVKDICAVCPGQAKDWRLLGFSV